MRRCRTSQWGLILVVSILWIQLSCPASAATTCTWNNGGDKTNWFDAANWTALPGAGDSVVIPSGYSILLTNSTPELDSFSITNSTLTFTNWMTALQATNVTIWNNGKLTHSGCNTNPVVSNTNRVYIIASNVTIEAGGKIDVNLMGYSYGGYSVAGQGQTNGYGQGPGGGHCNWLPNIQQGFVGGAHHGGFGARADGVYLTYDTAEAPTTPGSGGGGLNWTHGYLGTAGGGAVRIQASGRVTVNGQILANSDPVGNYRGAGSGGSIFISCDQFAGVNGLIQADGGGTTAAGLNAGGGAGGGGRVAIVYSPSSQATVSPKPTVRLSAAGGYGTLLEDAQRVRTVLYGSPGTIYLPDDQALSQSIMGGILVIPGWTSWSPASLTVSGGTAEFTNDFQLTITNQLVIEGYGGLRLSNSVVNIGGDLTITNSSAYGKSFIYGGPAASLAVSGNAIIGGGRIEISAEASTNSFPVTVSGNMMVTNAAQFRLYSGPTNGTASGWGVRVSVTGSLVVATNAFIYPYSHPTNGGSVLFEVSNLTVAAGGSINADGLGFAAGWSGYGVGKSQANGWGPGGGFRNTAPSGGNTGGGGYGGRGGRSDGTNGMTYGSASAPAEPGSGGGSLDWTGGYYGSPGGGYVRIQASGRVTVHGTITANSMVGAQSDYRGGGSGGGIYIVCNTFQSTSGVITANGADYGGTAANAAAGGGGRVAIVYDGSAQAVVSPKPSVKISAGGGYGPYIEDARRNRILLYGEPGTIYLTDASFFPAATLWGGRIVTPGFMSWSPTNLTILDAGAGLPSGFTLNVISNMDVGGTAGLWLSNVAVNIGGNLTVTNSSSYGKSFIASGPTSSFTVAGNMTLGGSGRFELRSDATHPVGLSVNRNLTLTNSAALHIYSAMTDWVAPDYGALVNVNGDITVASNCVIYPYSHQTNGGSVLFVAGAFTLAQFATINADGLGYAGGLAFYADGNGPGKGKGQLGPTGGGYGGAGGGAVGVYGQTNGSSNAPIHPGSGPGSTVNFAQLSDGGGAVRIRAARTVIINGTITANTANTGNDYASGSGGAIYILCKTFAGNGTLRANGGNFTGTIRGAAGGGGRIAIWRSNHTFSGTATAAGGTSVSYPGYQGGDGTVVWGVMRSPGTVVVIR
jgi:hypothetical protein